MWYRENNNLDRNKPIFAKDFSNSENDTFILLPQIKCGLDKQSIYSKHIGYNWFNLRIGEYITDTFSPTIEEAILALKGKNYKIFNGKLEVWREDD